MNKLLNFIKKYIPIVALNLREIFKDNILVLLWESLGRLIKKSTSTKAHTLHFLMLIINLVVFFKINDFELHVEILLSVGMVLSQLLVISSVIDYLIRPLKFVESNTMVDGKFDWFIEKQKKSFINRTFITVFFLDFISLFTVGEPIIMNCIGFFLNDILSRASYV